MLYDEEGRAYVEPPLLPEEQHLRYIVRDYHRMYKEFYKLEDKVAKMGEKNSNMAHYIFFLRGVVMKQLKLIDDFANRLKNRGHTIEKSTVALIEDFRRVAYPDPTKRQAKPHNYSKEK